VTAAEFMAELAQDEDFQRRKTLKDPEHRARGEALRAAEQPIVDDLNRNGMDPLASLDQIDEKWRQVFPHDFFAGEVVWLQLTAEGRSRAKALAEAEGWTPQWRG
jgi:hypothetical protein